MIAPETADAGTRPDSFFRGLGNLVLGGLSEARDRLIERQFALDDAPRFTQTADGSQAYPAGQASPQSLAARAESLLGDPAKLLTYVAIAVGLMWAYRKFVK